MQCLRCLQKGHPASNFKKTITNTKSGEESDEVEYKLSISSKSTKNSKAASITKLHYYNIKTKKTLTTLITKIEDMKNEHFDLNNSYDDGK